MLAKKCDRCGEYYDNYHNLLSIAKARANGIALIDIDDATEGYLERKYIDLCPNCLNDFQSWMTKVSERGIANAE